MLHPLAGIGGTMRQDIRPFNDFSRMMTCYQNTISVYADIKHEIYLNCTWIVVCLV